MICHSMNGLIFLWMKQKNLGIMVQLTSTLLNLIMKTTKRQSLQRKSLSMKRTRDLKSQILFSKKNRKRSEVGVVAQ